MSDLCVGICLDEDHSIMQFLKLLSCCRYPDCTYSLEDALTKDGTARLRSLCKEKLRNTYPSVVAVDINGNRELPAVLQCVENIMNPGEDVVVGTDWQLPRLVIVKSRLLYWEIKKQRDINRGEAVSYGGE